MLRIQRRDFLIAVGALLAAPFATEAQHPAKIARIGFLAGDLAGNPRGTEGFLQGLRDLGYEQGRNVAIEYRDAERKVERLPVLAAELVALNVDVIVATSSPAALATKHATKTIPIVFVTAADPVNSGLVTTIAHPGRNITGLSLLAPEIAGRQLQLLREAVPNASNVAVFSNPANSYTALLIKETEVAARALGMRVRVLGVEGVHAFDSAFSAIRKERPDVLLVLFDPLFFSHRTRIAEFASKNHLPAMYPHREYVEIGGLMAYGADLRDNYRRAASYVYRILKGAKPTDLPVEQPTKFELIINLKSAKALGLTLPTSLLGRADEVIQ